MAKAWAQVRALELESGSEQVPGLVRERVQEPEPGQEQAQVVEPVAAELALALALALEQVEVGAEEAEAVVEVEEAMACGLQTQAMTKSLALIGFAQTRQTSTGYPESNQKK